MNTNKIKFNINKSKILLFSYRKLNYCPKFTLSWAYKSPCIKIIKIATLREIPVRDHNSGPNGKLISVGHRIVITNQDFSQCWHTIPAQKFFPFQYTKKYIYFSLFHPYLNYALETWYGAPEYVVEKMKVSQRKAIRAILKLPYPIIIIQPNISKKLQF